MSAFDLVAAKLDEAKHAHRAELNRVMFAIGDHPICPVTWRDRLRWRVTRARRYVATLRQALRGDDPYDVERDIDW